MTNDVLVVIDMQNDFITGSLGTTEAAEIVDDVATRIRNHQGRVFYTQDTHRENYLETQEGHYLPVNHCQHGTEGWELAPAIADALKSRRSYGIEKDTFGSTELMLAMKAVNAVERMTSITIVGLCTDMCIINNAMMLKAGLPNVPIYVDASLCAGTTPEGHARALESMSACQVAILNA